MNKNKLMMFSLQLVQKVSTAFLPENLIFVYFQCQMKDP